MYVFRNVDLWYLEYREYIKLYHPHVKYKKWLSGLEWELILSRDWGRGVTPYFLYGTDVPLE